MFERSNTANVVVPRVRFTGNSASTATSIQLGRYSIGSGQTVSVPNNNTTVFLQVNRDDAKAFAMDYTMTVGEYIRTGTLVVTPKGGGSSSTDIAYTEDYTQNSNLNITLSAAMSVVGSSAVVAVSCAVSGAGAPVNLTYSVRHLA